VAQAGAALAAAAAYFSAHEPASPALLLVRQAQHLMGKSFHEVIEALLPSYAEQAAIRFGVDQVFELPIQRLSGFGADETRYGEAATEDGDAETEASTETDGEESGSRADSASLPLSESIRNAGGPSCDLASTAARTRHEAVALLEQVGVFYRANEPASPIPLLTDRACGLSQKDFLTLLKDVLPGLKAPTSD
jgi:type VI secretion system protein ImpA